MPVRLVLAVTGHTAASMRFVILAEVGGIIDYFSAAARTFSRRADSSA
jgi:hypothetical protein